MHLGCAGTGCFFHACTMKRRGGRKSHRPGAGERLGGGVKRRAEPGMPSEATSSGVPPSMAAAAAAEGGAGMEPDELEFEDPFIDEEDADEDGQVIEEDHVFADDPDKLNIDLSEGTDGAVVKVRCLRTWERREPAVRQP